MHRPGAEKYETGDLLMRALGTPRCEYVKSAVCTKFTIREKEFLQPNP